MLKRIDSFRNNSIGLRVSSAELMDIDIAARNMNMTVSEFMREAIEEKLTRNSENFIARRKEQLTEQLKELEKHQELLNTKKDDAVNLSRKEIIELLEASRVIEKNPDVLDGRIARYINMFKKDYKISRAEYQKLRDIAELEARRLGIVIDDEETKNRVITRTMGGQPFEE